MPGGQVFFDKPIKRGVGLFGLLVGVAGVKVPASHQRQRAVRLCEPKHVGLSRDRRHPRMHGQAGHAANLLNRLTEGLADQRGIPHLDRVAGAARQGGEKRGDPGDEPWAVCQELLTQQFKAHVVRKTYQLRLVKLHASRSS